MMGENVDAYEVPEAGKVEMRTAAFPEVTEWGVDIGLGLGGVHTEPADGGKTQNELTFTVNWWGLNDDPDTQPPNVIAFPYSRWEGFVKVVQTLDDTIKDLRRGINTVGLPPELAEYVREYA